MTLSEASTIPRFPLLGPHSSAFKENFWAVNKRQQSSVFQSRDLVGHTENICTLEFSGDGSFLVSGSVDKTVRLWSFSQGNEVGDVSPVFYQQMKTKHESNVNCLAVSSDNHQIFSSGKDSNVFIHDTTT